VDWDGRTAARRREAVTQEHGMGETSFRGDLVFLGERASGTSRPSFWTS
jgi:hypothetical protein